jgi:hypothetical protein
LFSALLCVAPLSTARGQAESDAVKRVEQLSEQAMSRYEAGDFSGAIALYLKAHKIAPSAPLLYNIATIYDRKLNEKEIALDFYRRFVGAPDAEADLVKKALPRIQALKLALEAQEVMGREASVPTVPATPAAAATAPAATTTGPAAAPQPTQTPATTVVQETPTDPGAMIRTAGLISAGAGLVSLVVGSIYGLRAKSRNDSAKEHCEGSVCYNDKGLRLTENALSDARTANVGIITGVLLTAGGVAAFVLFWDSPSSVQTASLPPLTITPTLGPRTVGLSMQGAW